PSAPPGSSSRRSSDEPRSGDRRPGLVEAQDFFPAGRTGVGRRFGQDEIDVGGFGRGLRRGDDELEPGRQLRLQTAFVGRGRRYRYTASKLERVSEADFASLTPRPAESRTKPATTPSDTNGVRRRCADATEPTSALSSASARS